MKINKTPDAIWQEYLDGVGFNQQIGLYETVKRNNDFYHDRQWEGVNAPNLPKPIINIIKPAVNYYIAQLVSDDIGVNLECKNLPEVEAGYINEVVTKELLNILEKTNAAMKHRQLLRNMAVDGDMVLYSYFDPLPRMGDNTLGQIQTEIVYNTDIFFGNPMEGDVQKQPYLMIKQRRLLQSVREEAKKNGCKPEDILSDQDIYGRVDDPTGEKRYVTVLIKFWKENQQVHYCKTTQNAWVKKETNLEYSLYPIAYASWERARYSYHGISPITGKIQNQITINKIYAMAAIYTQNMAFPKVIYDRQKLREGWNNDPTKAIAVNGNPNEAIFNTFRPADMGNQVQSLLKQLLQDTKESMGVFDAALGNVKPDNTSAIIATQKAASAPLDLQRLDFYQFVEDCVRIWLDMMATDYGIRQVILESDVNQPMQQAATFDFRVLQQAQYQLAIDIGASSYWSELMQVQTLDNLMNLHIIPDALTYLENVPDGYIKGKQNIIRRIEELQQQQQMQQQMQANQAIIQAAQENQPMG